MKRNFGPTFGRTKEGYRQEYEELEKRLKEQPPVDPVQVPIVNPVNIIPNDDSWLIENNEYKLQLAKSLISPQTQEKQVSDYLTSPNSFKPSSYQELFILGKMLFNGNINQKDEILKFLRESFEKNWIQTSSGVLYKPDGKDKVIHDKGMSSEYSLETRFRGPDRYVEQADETALKYLTGLKDLDEIKGISQFLTNKDKTHLWRVNSKPKQEIYRVARFLAGSDRAYLCCGRVPNGSVPALGVRVVKKI